MKGKEWKMMKKILVVDDDESVRMVLRKMLETLTVEVGEAGDGEAGLERLAREKWDLVIADYRMPGLDGLTMLRQCREAAPHLPCILISGDPCVNTGRSSNIFFFKKPLDYGSFMMLVKHVLKMNGEKAEQLSRAASEL